MTELTFIQKIADVQSELKAPKDKKAYSFSYRNAEEILGKVKPLLHKHGLVVTFDDKIIEVGGRVFYNSTCTIFASKEDGISGNAIVELLTPPMGKNGPSMNESQASGATLSYAHKYALGSVLGIDDGTDADDERYIPSEQYQSQRPLSKTNYRNSKPISEKQITLIKSMRDNLKISDPSQYEELSMYYKAQYGVKKVEDLSTIEASKFIDRMMNPPKKEDYSEYSSEPFVD